MARYRCPSEDEREAVDVLLNFGIYLERARVSRFRKINNFGKVDKKEEISSPDSKTTQSDDHNSNKTVRIVLLF